MPRSPKKPCSFPGCPKLTEGRYCPEHAKVVAKQYEQHDRDPLHGTRYGSQWQRIRKAYANAHPLCEQCLSEGRYVKTEEIHHKIPLREGGTNAASNLVALCKTCHARLHVERGDRWGKRGAKASSTERLPVMRKR